MKVHLHGDVKSWDDLKPGALFYVMLGGDACFGLKAVGSVKEGDAFDRCIFLSPSKKHGKTHVWAHEHLLELPLLELKDALLVPGEISDSKIPDAGDLVQTADGVVLTVLNVQDHGRTNTPSVNMLSGQYATLRPQHGFIAFKGWKIVLPSAVKGEDDQTICEWPLPRARAAAA